jgi:WD40 repeat protein
MAILRICLTLILALLLGTIGTQVAKPADAASELFDRPALVIDPGMHTAPIMRASADKDGRWAVTGSHDKTVRVWSLADGTLLRTIRLPAGPGDVGKVYAVAISPNGALIAAGGFTNGVGKPRQIYLFDRASGVLVRRIKGLPNVVLHLTFSLDGGRLAATLFGRNGLRVYAGARGWDEVARDTQYSDSSYGAAFSSDGRLATTSYDGKIRLYAADIVRSSQPMAVAKAPDGDRPFGIAFSPNGTRLAIGHDDTAIVDVLDAQTLAPLVELKPDRTQNGNLSKVAWSRNGQMLFAAGRYWQSSSHPVLAWDGIGAGAPRILPAGTNTVMSLIPLPNDDLLVAAQDPWLARLRPNGVARWMHGPPGVDLRAPHGTFSVSDDGTRVGFGFEDFGRSPARFDVATRVLTTTPEPDDRMVVARQHGLPIAHWRNEEHPTLDGEALQLQAYEISRSLAIHSAGGRFVLGTEWYLRAFDAHGTPLWQRPAPSIVWAVNITGDGRLVVAAYGDGTIRWHRMSDGVELLAFMPLADRSNWVAWTPEGFYSATAGAHGVLRWHVNRGWGPADSVAIEDISGSYRPAMLPLVLQELETPRALGLTVLVEHNREVMLRTNSHVPPGARLHLLTVGISHYNEDYAKKLRLHYADRDAHDLASAIVSTQGSLYQVQPQVLLDKDATKLGILRALGVMRANMAANTGADLAVIHFSGHGAMVDGKLYLLPQDVNATDAAAIKASALSADDLRDELHEIAKSGRVLVLLDACHSGATTMNGAAIALNVDALRTSLAAANVTVLTSSKGSETSEERDIWQHGAFTKALLDAFNDPAADTARNGLISTTGLANYLNVRVPMLTDGRQTPGMEVRFDTTVFASGS